MTAHLQREEEPATSKRVRRLLHDLELVGHAPKRRGRTTNRAHPSPRSPHRVADRAVTQPNQVWVADLTCVRVPRDFVSLAVLMHVYIRAIRGWELSRRLDQTLTLSALHRALSAGHVPTIHPVDQGVQYAATAYVTGLEQLGVHVSMAAVGEPRQNGYAERLMRTINEEEGELSESQDVRGRRRTTGALPRRGLSPPAHPFSRGYLTPAEFAAAWRTERPLAAIPYRGAFMCPARPLMFGAQWSVDIRAHETAR